MFMSENIRKSMAGGSWIRRMFEEGAVLRRQYGEDRVFDLTLGNPVMEPPPQFRVELKRLVEDPSPGMHRYMPNAGYPETRAAVAEQLSLETGVKFGADDIIMSCGAAGACNVVLRTILNPGDEVILFAPYFVEYVNYVDNFGGTARILPTDARFVPKLDALESAVKPNTKAIVINSPNNPSGAVYGEDLLRDLGEIVRRKEAEFGTPIYILSDEAYRKLVYDGIEFPFPLHHHPNTITVTSHSKDLALPGERIGYIAVHPECAQRDDLIEGMVFCTRTLGFVNAPALMQHLLPNLQGVSVSIDDYQRKRDFLYGNLVDMGYSVVRPQGAFYLFPETPVEDDVAFVRELQELMVLAVPGSGFGGPGHIRISYCVDDRTLDGSLDGFRQVARKHGLCQ